MQAKFVAEYLVDLNATQAAIRAGYSAKTAEQQGPRLLGNVGVMAAIRKAQAKRSERTNITADLVLEELAKIATAKLSDVVDWGMKQVAVGYNAKGKRLKPEDIGDAERIEYIDEPFVTPINRDDLPEHIRAAVAEVSLGKDGFKIKMHDKNAALVSIGRHLGMFKDKVEHSGTLTLEALIAESLPKLAQGVIEGEARVIGKEDDGE